MQADDLLLKYFNEKENTYECENLEAENGDNTNLKTMLEDIMSLKAVIESLGPLPKGKELTGEQKINFAYQFPQIDLKHSLLEIFKFLEKNKIYDNEDFSLVLMFFRNYLNNKRHRGIKDDKNLYDNEKYLSASMRNWLRDFNINDKFKVQNGKPTVTLTYISSLGEPRVLTYDMAINILNILEENNIPLKNCIVNEAFRRYADDDIENFMSELKNGYTAKIKRL